MANRRRGEVPLALGGDRYTLCLTLGALADLEDSLRAGDLAGLGQRLAAGRPRSVDLIALLGAALRGGGHALTDADVRALPLAGGMDALVDALAEVLEAAFGAEPSPHPDSPAGKPASSRPRPQPGEPSFAAAIAAPREEDEGGIGERIPRQSPPSPFPWDDALSLALGPLGWRPADFWAATPRELAAALGRTGAPDALGRAEFEGLLAAHPDPSPCRSAP